MYNARYIALKIKSEVGNRYKLKVTVFESRAVCRVKCRGVGRGVPGGSGTPLEFSALS